MKGSLLQAACGMEIFMNSIIGNQKARSAVEQTAEIIFTICAFFAVLAVISITVYMFLNGTPALTKVGLTEILFGTVWKPTAADPSYGILYVILTSIVGTTLAILLGVPIGVLTAVFLAETAPEPLSKIVPPLNCWPVSLPLSTVCSVSCCCALQCINSNRKSLQALRPISLPAVQTLFQPCLSLRS